MLQKVAFILHLSKSTSALTVPSIQANNSVTTILAVKNISQQNVRDELIMQSQIKLAGLLKLEYNHGAKELSAIKMVDDLSKVDVAIDQFALVDTFMADKKLHVIYVGQKTESGWTGKYTVRDPRYIGYFEAVDAEGLSTTDEVKIDEMATYISELELSEISRIDELKKCESDLKAQMQYAESIADENIELRKVNSALETKLEEMADKLLDTSLRNLELISEINQLRLAKIRADEIVDFGITETTLALPIPEAPKQNAKLDALKSQLNDIRTAMLEAASFDKTKLLTREQRDKKIKNAKIKKMKAVGEQFCLTKSGLLF